jgi:hypothetical protein
MNKLLFIILVVLNINAQDTIIIPRIDLYKRNIIEVSHGKPLGQLANKYESSINTAFYMRTKIGKGQFIDFGAELSGIVKGKPVTYVVNNEKIKIEGSKSSFLLGLRYTFFIYKSKNEDFHIESNSGAGWKYLYYSKPDDANYDEIDFSPTLNTIAFTQGLKLMFYGFGVHCSYHFSPYALFDPKAERNFGASSINFGLSGSWNF